MRLDVGSFATLSTSLMTLSSDQLAGNSLYPWNASCRTMIIGGVVGGIAGSSVGKDIFKGISSLF